MAAFTSKIHWFGTEIRFLHVKTANIWSQSFNLDTVGTLTDIASTTSKQPSAAAASQGQSGVEVHPHATSNPVLMFDAEPGEDLVDEQHSDHAVLVRLLVPSHIAHAVVQYGY